MEMSLQTTSAESGALEQIESSRAMQEVQASMVIAKRFPRNHASARNRIMEACQRPSLAAEAIYTYPRGNTTVEGPSIRLAEAMAQSWGNMQSGVIEISQSEGQSEVMAFCWDLETNMRDTKIFQVPHYRETKSGGYWLKDSRDIYEHVANTAARRKRACILAILPEDIVKEAVEECKKTLARSQTDPISERIEKMKAAFESFGVSADAIQKRLGHSLESMTETEYLNLRGIYNSINNEQGNPADYFDLTASPQPETPEERPSGPEVEETATPGAESSPDAQAGERPKRKRRTKAEIEADKKAEEESQMEKATEGAKPPPDVRATQEQQDEVVAIYAGDHELIATAFQHLSEKYKVDDVDRLLESDAAEFIEWLKLEKSKKTEAQTQDTLI